MRALSIGQSWAFAVVISAKTVENRTWSSVYVRAPAIHPCKREERAAVVEVLRTIHVQLRLRFDLDRLHELYEANRRLGCVVGQVDMIGCADSSDADAWDQRQFDGLKGRSASNSRTPESRHAWHRAAVGSVCGNCHRGRSLGMRQKALASWKILAMGTSSNWRAGAVTEADERSGPEVRGQNPGTNAG